MAGRTVAADGAPQPQFARKRLNQPLCRVTGLCMAAYDKLLPPSEGNSIEARGDGTLEVPNEPVIPFIEGDGTGPDIWAAAQEVFDAAVARAFAGRRRIRWLEVFAGEKACRLYGDNQWLPKDTLRAIAAYRVAIKGPLTTPVGGGMRSVNVALRQELDLYACVRPVRHYPGVPSPVREPGRLDVVIFRENTEDVYMGLEWAPGSAAAEALIAHLNRGPVADLGRRIRPDSGIGIKPISREGSRRLVRRAVDYALAQGRRSVTLVHKGNIMKFTEGAFRDWGYQLAAEVYGEQVISEADVASQPGGQVPAGRLVIKDRIADAMFQQILLRPDEYDVIATTNLNGDYLSDACAAQVGGLGLAPGANIGAETAVFEATHGTAPKYAGQDKVNPGSVILSGAMMFAHLGWQKAADLIEAGLARTIAEKMVTYDLARQMEGATPVGCRRFGRAIVDHMARL